MRCRDPQEVKPREAFALPWDKGKALLDSIYGEGATDGTPWEMVEKRSHMARRAIAEMPHNRRFVLEVVHRRFVVEMEADRYWVSPIAPEALALLD